MAPEQIEGGAVDRRTDVFAAATVLWEALVGRFLFSGTEAQLLYSVLSAPIPPPTSIVPELPRSLEAVVLKGLQRNPDQRFSSALEMADALEAAMRPATSRTVARWVKELAANSLEQRAKLIRAIELEEHSLGHLSVRRESGTIPSKLGDRSGTDHAVEAVERGESSHFDRHTMPLPVQSNPPLATSAVHSRGYTSQRTLWRRRGWRAIAAAALAALGVALFAIAARVRSHDTNASTHSRSQGAALVSADRLERQLATSVPPVSATADPVRQLSPYSTPTTPSRAAPSASQQAESVAEDRTQSKRSEFKDHRVISTKRAKPAAPDAPAASPLNGKTHDPLYIRD
jgi:serine/threonine protein kinase